MSTAFDFSVVVTDGGGRAVADAATGEVMHPVVGGRMEAELLYIRGSRLRERIAEASCPPLVVLDVGLGAGSNAIAAVAASEGAAAEVSAREAGSPRPVTVVSFDRTSEAMRLAVNHPSAVDFGYDALTLCLARTFLARGQVETERTRWRFVPGELPSTLGALPDGAADIVFWDPFSPKANPGLWGVAAFAALRRVCRAGATVHTYSASTRVRAALLLAGFSVGVGEPCGKAVESTVAALAPAALRRPLDQRWLARWRRSTAALPPDAPADAADRIGNAAQFR